MRSSRAGVIVTAAVLCLGAGGLAWWLLGGDEAGGAASAVRGADRDAPSVVALPAPVVGVPPVELEPLDASSATAPGAPPAADDAGPPPFEPLALRLLHADDVAAGGAQVVALDASGDVHAEGVADADGRFRCDGHDGPVRVYAVGLSPEPGTLRLDVGRGEHVLRLPPGAVLAGRVLVDGAPPGGRFPLAIDAADVFRPWFEWYDGALQLAVLPGVLKSGRRGGFLTDERGRFRLSGFAPGTRLRLEGPRHYRRDEVHASPEPVELPAHDHVVALREPAMIRGRALTPEGRPAADARVSVQVSYHAPPPEEGVRPSHVGGWSWGGETVDAQGRFAVPLDPVRSMEAALAGARDGLVPGTRFDVVLELRSETHGRARVERADLDARHDVELGDIVLAPEVWHLLRVLGPDGAPVADAIVRMESATQWFAPVTRTDADGLARVSAADADRGVATVLAPGLDSARVPLPEVPSEQPLVVPLTAATRVDLDVLWPARWELRLANVRVVGEAPLFQEGTLPPLPGHSSSADPAPQRQQMFNVSSSGFGEADGERFFECSFGREGVHLEGLRTHHALRLAIGPARDPAFMGAPFDPPYWESDALWLEPGEQRTIVVDLRDLDAPEPSRGDG